MMCSSASNISFNLDNPVQEVSKIECKQEIRGTYQEWEQRISQAQEWRNIEYESKWKNAVGNFQSQDEKILHFIALQAMDLFDLLFDELKGKSGPYKEDLSYCSSFFSTVADHYVTNASDSLLKCLLERKGSGYEALLYVRLSFGNGVLKLEIEDNGTGIPVEVEPRIFQEEVTTKAEQNCPHYGGKGLGLTNVSIMKNRLQGNAGFVNRGDNQGASFWFEASFAKCKELFHTPSYQRYLMKRYELMYS